MSNLRNVRLETRLTPLFPRRGYLWLIQSAMDVDLAEISLSLHNIMITDLSWVKTGFPSMA
jgi:hypothetical protein